MNYQSLLHPNSQVDVSSLVKRLNALETKDNRYALRGGTKVTYDSTGRISSLYVENADIVNINASKITAGDISANRMAANVLSALQVNVNNLSAISANIGTVTAGSITGVTITGGLFRTSTSGARVEIDGDGDTLKFYNAGGYNIGGISPTSGVLLITGAWNFDDISVAELYPNMISMLGELSMNGSAINSIKELKFNDTNSNYDNDSWEIWGYNSGEKGFRCRVNGSLYQFDLTSK